MKNPWPFAILILIFFGYFAWNNFELPLLGKKEKVKGIIYEIKIHPGLRGMGFVQGISFFYSFNNKWYEGHYVSNSRNSIQNVGNSISLNVQASNPKRVKVMGFFKQKYYGSAVDKYYSICENGHSELVTENNIYKQTGYFNSSDSSVVIIGCLKQTSDDSIKLIPIKHSIYKKNMLTDTKILNGTNNSVFRLIKEDMSILNLANKDKNYIKIK